MAAIQGCVPGRAVTPPIIRPLAMDILFLCRFPHTGFLAGLVEFGHLTLGRTLTWITLREEAVRGNKLQYIRGIAGITTSLMYTTIL